MTHICSQPSCQNTFQMNPAGNKKYCSAACRKLSRINDYHRTCGLSICSQRFSSSDSRKKYCSRRCAAIANNSLRSETRMKRFCWCGKPLQWFQKVGCTRSHAAQIRCKKYIDDWLMGKESGCNENGVIKARIRNYLLEQANHRCQSPTCAVPGGWSVPNPVTGTVILTIDHIDGNWKNNTVDNLIVLCYSCHTLTPTFGALNAGSASGTRLHGESRKR